MENSALPDSIADFQSPRASFDGLDTRVAAQLITAGSDVALVIDQQGIIQDVSFGSEDMSREGYECWLGKSWEDTVAADSRQKIRQILKDALSNVPPRWRQVNHPSKHGEDVPVRYFAVNVGRDRIVAIGRDLRAVATLQQRLLQAQGAMERDYSRLRQMETRYRMLFEASSEAVLIIDLESRKIVEANSAAATLFDRPQKLLIGRPFAGFFGADDQAAVLAAMATGRADNLAVRIAQDGPPCLLSATTFRNDRAPYLLVRVATDSHTVAGRVKDAVPLQTVFQNMPEGFVVTDPELRILMANAAFVELAHLATEDQVCGEALERFIGRSDVDLQVLVRNLRQEGYVRQFGTVFRDPMGAGEDVEIAAVSVDEGEYPCFGFTIRTVGTRLGTSSDQSGLPGSAEELTALVGRLSLKEIVRETTDIIERLCIQTALELTSDNRASAAEILGLSRQSLYAKLRRHSLLS